MHILASIALLAGCAAVPGSPPAGPVLGTWGGQHARVEFTPTGGSAQFDCAHGNIDQPVLPSPDGKFDAAGSFIREHGGPVREGETLPSFPGRYVGVVAGGRMTFSIELGDGERIGPFEIVEGSEGQVYRCL